MSDVDHAAAIRRLDRLAHISGNQVPRTLVGIIEDMRCHADELDRELAGAEARAARLRSGLLSDDAIRAATKAVGHMERTSGPDPNGYIRYTARDYAEAAITAALHVVVVSGGLEPEAQS